MLLEDLMISQKQPLNTLVSLLNAQMFSSPLSWEKCWLSQDLHLVFQFDLGVFLTYVSLRMLLIQGFESKHVV